MNSDLYNSYFNFFTTSLSTQLKPGWGIRMTVYPFKQGAVIVINMKMGAANSLEKKQVSDNLGMALAKTTLFSAHKIKPISDKTIGQTMVGINSLTKYVLFKNDKETSWDEKAAQKDVKSVIEKTRAMYG